MTSGDPVRTEQMKRYVLGVGDGLSWGSIGGKAPLFCPPPSLALVLDNYLNILNTRIAELDELYAEKIENVNRRPIGLALLEGLEKTFPCSTK